MSSGGIDLVALAAKVVPSPNPTAASIVASNPPRVNAPPAPSLLPPGLMTTKAGEEPNTYAPPVNNQTHVVILCSDEVLAVVPQNVSSKFPFQCSTTETTNFPFNFATLTAIYYWCEQYTAKGVSAVTIPSPNPFTAFEPMVKDKGPWEKEFFEKGLSKGTDGTILYVINAAEKYGMDGLFDLAIAALSCVTRGSSESEILGALHCENHSQVTDEERAAVTKNYSWFKDATATKKK